MASFSQILLLTLFITPFLKNLQSFEPTTGFEPVTSSLPRKCSTAELRRRIERVMGIEPTSPAWKAGVLPLNYTRTVGREGFEPPKAYAGRFTVCSLWPLGHLPSLSIILNRLVCLTNIYEPPRGLEPPTD